MKYRNFTPHTVVLNDGTEYQSEGKARIADKYDETEVPGEFRVTYGEVQGLPAPQPNVKIIVSAMVLDADGGRRKDLVAPATGHPDTIRDERGFIVSVPGFVTR